jgi:hypothetical protein
MPTTMQIRTRRRRGRKISRRRQRKVSQRQSRGGGSRYNSQYTRASNKALFDSQKQEASHRRQNEIQVDRYHEKLANKIFTETPAIVENLFESGSNGETNFKQQVRRQYHTRFNLKVLIVALLMVAMTSKGDALMLGKGIRRKVSTSALQHAWDERSPKRPGEIWSFWRQFNMDGKGGWEFESIGPPLDPKANYSKIAEQHARHRRGEEYPPSHTPNGSKVRDDL